MGFVDKAKQRLTKVVEEHGETLEKGADRLGRTVNERTGNKHADKVAKGTARLKKGLHSLDPDRDQPHNP